MSNSERVRAHLDTLNAHLAQLVTGQDWQRLLAVASRFHSYSPRNVLAIHMQRPGATYVAGYRRWQAMGRQVRRGEHGLAILAPCTYKADPGDQAPDPDDPARVVRGFKVVTVFDVSQTTGEPLPEVPRPELLTGDSPAHLLAALVSLTEAEGYAVQFGPLPDGLPGNGLTRWSDRGVWVRDDMAQAQQAKTAAHELAHVRLHDPSGPAVPPYDRCEVEAESVAYVVCAAHGLDSATYSLPYVAGWAHGDIDLVLSTTTRVMACAHTVLDALDTLIPTA